MMLIMRIVTMSPDFKRIIGHEIFSTVLQDGGQEITDLTRFSGNYELVLRFFFAA